MNSHEQAAARILSSVYENATAFSLRDRDEDPYEIEDTGAVVRARLNCRTSENLLLSDDALKAMGTDWETLKVALIRWMSSNSDHPRYGDLREFSDSWDRMSHSIKNVRNLIVGLSGSNKPWEVAVGQAIADIPQSAFSGVHSISNYLGQKVVTMLSLQG